MAEIEVSRKDFRAGLSFYQKALQANRQIHFDLGCLQILEDIGYLIYYEPGRGSDKALAYYKKAMGYIDPENKTTLQKFEILNLFTNIANVYVEQSNYDSAFYYFQSAFNQVKHGLNENTLLASPLDSFFAYRRMPFLIALLIDKGDACLKAFRQTRQQHFMKDALRIYTVSDQLLDRIKAEQSEITSKLFWRKNTHRLYEHAIEASYLDHNPENAFYFFEKSRAVLLNDQLNLQSKAGSDHMLAQAQVKKKILQLKWEQDTLLASSGRYAEIQNEIFTCNDRLEGLGKIIQEKDPLYYQSFLDTAIITLQNIKNALLKDQQALLELFTGDSSVYTLLITSNDTRLNKINKAEFGSAVNSYTAYISNPTLLNREYNNYIKIAGHLYSLMFADKPPAPGRIIISPDNFYFPFEGLVSNTLLTAPVYFLADHAVSYTYSARYLLNNFTEDKSLNIENFLGVAPVEYAAAFSLSSLPGSDLSLNRIGSGFNNQKNLTHGQATRNNFLNQYAKYKIIQLYTHASDSGRNGEPVIYFADSALFLSELIPETKPGTRLIVVSACETANGQLYQGEGVFSFNRGFASLGIPSAITNLWSVDNQSTYRITENFYKYISEGAPADIALQKAKLKFIGESRENRPPYFQAAAILTRKSEVFAGKKKRSWPYIVLITAGIAAFSFFGLRKRGKIV